MKGNANNDGVVNIGDMVFIRVQLSGRLNTTNMAKFELYNDLCDVNKDGAIRGDDMVMVRRCLGARADWR